MTVPDRRGTISADGGAVSSRGGSLSALIEELARAPSRDVREAWDRGLRPGEVVGRFEIVRELGRGGFGVVFEARDLELGRMVAFKAIRPGVRDRDPGREALLRREAEAVAQLQHPAIVTLFDFGRCDSGPYLILELLRGEPLARRLDLGPLPPPEAVRVAIQVTRALVHAHGQGVLHRDLKPANVFLGEHGTVKVLDFGLAHVFGAGGPAGSGTPGYMPPEQLRGAEDARSDVWAVGVLLHEMVSGRQLFGAGSSQPAPRLQGPGLPVALAVLVARCLDEDPARRPRDAQALLDSLLAVERIWSVPAARRVRRRWIAAIVVAASMAAAAVGWILGSRRESPVMPVVVADVRNETGDADLDGVAGLLAASLEQSRRLSVPSRQRLLDLLGERGRPGPVRLDDRAAREAAVRVRAGALLLPAVRRDGQRLAVEVRGTDPRDGRELFELREEARSETDVPALVDRLSTRVRRALNEGEAEMHASKVAVGRALTEDLEAYRHFFLAEQCAARPIYGQDCGVEYRRAVARDPSFALAHYRLAVWTHWYGGTQEEQRSEIGKAVANAGRVPEKERLLIRAWKAHLDGGIREAIELCREVTRRWPDDKEAWFQGGDLHRHVDDFEGSIPWFERAVAIDPDDAWALAHLVESLGATGRLDDLGARARAWEQDPRPPTLHALSLAYGWLGDPAGAADAARRGAALGAGLLAQEDLLAARVFAGDYAGATHDFRALAAPQSEVRPIGFYALAAMEAYQGRPRAGLAVLDVLRRERPQMSRDALYWSVRIDYLLGLGNARAAWSAVEALRGIDPGAAAEHAPGLAWLGDLPHAAELARGLDPATVAARSYAAVARWHRGEQDGALADLREIAGTTPITTWRVAPIYLYGDLAARSGRDAEAAAALERFHRIYLPRAMWRCWAYPRSLLLMARAQERLGGRARAREAVDRLLAAWTNPEPDAPMLEEARSLRARLETSR